MKKWCTCLLAGFTGLSVFSQITQTFTADSTFTVPSGVTLITIEVVGAGGAGGGNGGGGGGGGGYSKGDFSVVPGQVMTVTVGDAGAGLAGGTTSVDNLIIAYGGENGFSVPNPTIGGGGNGGGAVGGTINHTGGTGGGGYWTYFGGGAGGAAGITANGGNGGNTIPWTGICMTPGGDAGISGGAPGGDGGKGAGFTDAACNVTNPAGNGLNYGGGGGGGNGNGGAPGSGMNGYATITYNSCTADTGTTTVGTTISADAAGLTYQWISCDGDSILPGETNQSFTPVETGNYAVIVDNGSCADTSTCVNVLICSLTATTTVQNDTINAIQIGTYQWINCSGNIPVGGETNQQFVPLANGSYAVIINDAGCTDTSACVVISNVGIENVQQNTWVVFPNPFHNSINILHTDGGERYELTNAVGQLIWTGTQIEHTDFSHLTNGIYFLRMMNKDRILQTKLWRQ